ncbi:sulfatase [Plantactinospora sp. KLBMP9567]|uniref:sulfatase family protein n=1 Tax=Plantactinospora sp. KLBMP9567 TaxID=3085900 RepID=UPI00298295DF|nr:sulfatase [Plantactinospora sp. KLBMP9567]MDW5324421.1 sulfatase [Plantactinospora sp. KLBMP9567]
MDSRGLNVLVLHSHDLGRFLGCYGVPTVDSPNLDRLAASGVRFSRAFSTAPQCSPSRASLFTGRFPQQNGVLGLTHAQFGWDLRPGERHLADRLAELGYLTSLIGVHHESRVRPDEEVAQRLGFDEVLTGGQGEVVADRAIDRLVRFADLGRPFYLQVGFREPHRLPGRRDPAGVMGFVGDHMSPYAERGVAVPDYLVDDASAREEIAELQGAVRYMDACVGRVLSKLDDLGLAESTIVVFVTDHGLALPRAKCTLYDPGLEIALLARAPALGWQGGRIVTDLVSGIDLVPTLLDALGRHIPADVAGLSQAPAMMGTAGRHHQAVFGQLTYHDYYDPRRCVRTGSRKLIVNFSSAPSIMDASQSWRRRCTPRVGLSGPAASHPVAELYDLDADPDETSNVIDDPRHADDRAALMSRLRQWLIEVDDPLLVGAVRSPSHDEAISGLGPGRERP